MKETIVKLEEKLKKAKEAKREYKNINKELFLEISTDPLMESFEREDSQEKIMKSPSKIHQIYQDFFITDMKKELGKAKS